MTQKFDIATMFASSRPLVIDVGVINSDAQQGLNILNCSGRNWGDDCLAGKLIEVYEGPGAPQMHVIVGNSRTGVVISGGVQPAVKSGARYRIYGVGPKDTGLISYSGTTSADGAADGSTLVCAGLVGKPDFDGNLVVVQSGAYRGQARDINGATTAGTVTPHLAFGGQITAGTRFTIYALRLTPAEVAALQADVGDASASALGSLYGILGNPAQSFTTRTERIEEGNAVYFDSGGVAGTDYPGGTPQSPVNNVADLLAICAARNINTVVIRSNLILNAAVANLTFRSESYWAYYVRTNNQQVDGCNFVGVQVYGGFAATGTIENYFKDCYIYMGGGNWFGLLDNCLLDGASLTCMDNKWVYFVRCTFADATTIDWSDVRYIYMFDCIIANTRGSYVYIGALSGTGNCRASLDLRGGVVDVYGVTGDVVNVYGDAVYNLWGYGFQGYDHTLTRLINQADEARKPSFKEFFLAGAIDPAIWTPTNPATGTAWGVIERGGYYVARTAPNPNETARLVSILKYPWAPYGNMLHALIIEFEMELDNAVNVDNALFFVGFTPNAADNRNSNNIFGLCLTGDLVYGLSDAAGFEDTVIVSNTPQNRHLYRIEVWPMFISFYCDEDPEQKFTDWVPTAALRYFNAFIDTEAGGAAQFYLGPVRWWYLDCHEYT